MKTTLILILVLIGFTSYSQKEGDDNFLISKRVDGSFTWTSYKEKNFDKKFIQIPKSYQLWDSSIDKKKIKEIAGEEISSKYYDQLNKTLWYFEAIITGEGKIESLSFMFRDKSGVDIEKSYANPKEFKKFAERIKKEVMCKLKFNKEVTDYFNILSSIDGPKL
jgi:hypothetical protein